MDDKLSIDGDIYDEIYETEMIIRKIEKGIRKLWYEVILPYKQDLCRAQILDKLDDSDYVKFYEFMITHNKAYQKATKFLEYLNNQI